MEGNRKKAITIGVIFIVVCAIVFAVLVGRNSPTNRVVELLDLGNKYLTEQDYEQAVVAFKGVIEIDPKCEEAYRGLADVYVAMDDYESAIDILQQGIVQTDSEELAAYLEEIREAHVQMQEEAVAQEKEEAEEEDRIREKPVGTVAIRIVGNTQYITQAKKEMRSGYVTEKDAKGNIVKRMEFNEFEGERIYEVDELPEWFEKPECEYDDDGNIVKATYYPEGYSFYTIYEHDDRGNVIREKTFDSEGTLGGEAEYEYDDYGNMVRESVYDNGKLSTERIYLWECEDESGEIRTIDMNEFEYNGADLIRATFYDETGEIIKENLY